MKIFFAVIVVLGFCVNFSWATPKKVRPAEKDPYQVYDFEDADALPPFRPTDPAVTPFEHMGSSPMGNIHFGPFNLVDLHAHLFMEHGLGILFNGDFLEGLSSNQWDDRFSNQVTERTLNASGLGLVVVSLYAHPILEPSTRDSIRKQIEAARSFVRRNPDWLIVRSPQEAKLARSRGKRLLVFSIEGASAVLDSENDFREFIDEAGVRIVTFAHLSDDHLTGAAFMKGYQRLATPLSSLGSVFKPKYNAEGTLVNPNGLTDVGRAVAQALIKRKVWIDLSHAPESTLAELIPMLKRAGQPLLYTHTALRRFYKAERETSDSQISAVQSTGGIIGLVPAHSVLKTTPIPGSCKTTFLALVEQWNYLASRLGDKNVYLGTDLNGAMDHLPATSRCPTGTSLDTSGYHNIGQTPALWWALQKASPHTWATAQHGVEHFIETWSRLYKNPASRPAHN